MTEKNIEQKIVPEKVIITENAKKKAQLLGPLVEDMGKSAYEWYGFLLGHLLDERYVVRDLILGQDQSVSGAGVSVEGAQVAKATEEVKTINKKCGTNYKIIGWIHNHADFGTFHSGTDHANIFTVLNSVSLNTERAVHKTLNLIESESEQMIKDGKIVIRGQELEDCLVEYKLGDLKKIEETLKKNGITISEGQDLSNLALNLFNDLLLAAKFEVKEPKIVGFCYSIVVNNKGDEPNAEIAVIEEDIISKKKKVYNKETSLEVIQVENDVDVLEDELKEDIEEKIRFPPRRTFIKTFWKGRKDEGEEKTTTIPEESVTEGSTQTSEKDEESSKDLSLDDMSTKFVEKTISYMRNTRSNYSQYISRVLARVIEGKNFREAVKETGVLAPDDRIKRDDPTLMRKVLEIIKSKVTEGVEKDDKSTMKLLEKIASDEKEIDGALERYIPKILSEAGIESRVIYKEGEVDFYKIDSELKQFTNDLISYAENDKRPYNKWVTKLIDIFLEEDYATLDEVILNIGKPKQNQDYSLELTSYTKKKFKEKFYLSQQSDDLMKFIKEFNNIEDESDLINKYAQKILSKIEKEEQDEIDKLIKGEKEKK